MVNNSRFRCLEKLLISIYNTTIWTKKNFTWTSSSIQPNDNYDAKNNNMLWSEYEKVSTDLNRSVQTALPISSSWNIRLKKRTNDSKHGKKNRLNLQQILKELKKSKESRKKHNRGSKKNHTKTLKQKKTVVNFCQLTILSTPLIKSLTIPDSGVLKNLWH